MYTGLSGGKYISYATCSVKNFPRPWNLELQRSFLNIGFARRVVRSRLPLGVPCLSGFGV